jgi:thioredoxin reductase (NADPH)
MESNAQAGVENLGAGVMTIEPAGDFFRVVTEAGEHRARTVVIASGAALRKLGVPGEEEFDHRGVSQCADCDGPMFQGEHVVVVGGGDSAFQEAVALSHYAGTVTMLLRGSTPRARPDWVERVRALDNVSIRTGVQVEAIEGTDTVQAVALRCGNGETERLECAGVFVFVGLKPNSAIAPAGVRLNEAAAIETDSALQTAVPRIFAAGAVRAGYSGKLIDAVREARSAAEGAARAAHA